MLQPDLLVSTIGEVTPELLTGKGIEAVLVDLDDTLVPAGGDTLGEGAAAWFRLLAASGFRVLILSNGKPARVAHWAEQLGVEGLPLVGKPLGRAFRRGLALLGSEPQKTAMVGDQVFTDVLGANRMGLYSILVSPLSPGRLFHTRLLRRVERRIVKE
ncbi:MAG TPA: YqeG family HAD IIIA-type phosphatase [Deinococcales bacterium]|nr:YqeG family HAD IIIA-type phosphatase [Deinococcales bacterium]